MGREQEVEAIERQTVTLNQLKEHVRSSVIDKKAGLEKGAPFVRTLFFWVVSPPGCGKSSLFDQLAREEHIGYRGVTCANLQEGDISGIPIVDEKSGKKTISKVQLDSIFPIAPPGDWQYFTAEDFNDLRSDDDEIYEKAKAKWDKNKKQILQGEFARYFNPGILFLDELGNVQNMSVRSEILKYTDGTYKYEGGYAIMPPSWIVVGAGNDEKSIGSDTFIEYAANVKERFVTLNLMPIWEEQRHYAINKVDRAYPKYKGWHRLVLSYLDEHKLHLVKELKQGEDNTANPRNWELLSARLRSFDERVASGTLSKSELERMDLSLRREIRALLGMEVGSKFIIYFEHQKNMIKVDEMLSKRLSDKKYVNLPITVKLLSMYNALENISAKEESKKAITKYINLIENTCFLFSNDVLDFVAPFVSEIINRENSKGMSSKDFSKEAQEAFKEAAKYNNY